MLRSLVICSLACAAATPAIAGDKPAKLDPAARALRLPAEPLAYGTARIKPRGVSLPAESTSSAKPLSANFVKLSAEAAPKARRFDYDEVRAMPGWRLTDERTETTAAAGGTYAVGDILSSQRKPRFRGSPLGALLVLRIDGQEDSPPISVGGGGVAAAVWKVVPR